MNELDKKLAKWAGFTYDEDAEFVNGMWVDRSKWMSPDRTVFYGDPQFIDSLDLCFQYLAPKVLSVTLDCDMELDTWARVQSQDYLHADGYALTPALAVCLAFEKLIDGEGK